MVGARCALALLLASTASAQLTVTGVAPDRHAVGVPAHPRIAMVFAQAVDPATVHAGTFRVAGRFSGPVPGALRTESGGTEIVFEPERPLFPGEWVDVLASSGIRALANGAPLTGGHAFGFWVESAPGLMQFTNVTTFTTRSTPGRTVRTYGGTAADVDRDGWPDLSLANEDTSDVRVFSNLRCGAFDTSPATSSMPGGSVPSPTEAADFNGDGWPDLVCGCQGSGEIGVLFNDGSGGFSTPVMYASGANTRGITVLDVEGDGDMDVVAANTSASQIAIHRNDGTGTFLSPTFFDVGPQERGVAAADADGDGWTDLFVADFSGQVTLMLNDGAGGFQASATVAVPGRPWMIVTGDVDGDGRVDAVTVNSFQWSASVVLGDGLGGLAPAPINVPIGAFPIAVDLGDLDGDGVLDMVTSNFSSSDFTVLRGGGGGGFSQIGTLATPSAGSCALLVDYDRDGDLDIVGIDEIADCVTLFQHDTIVPPGLQAPSCDAALRLDNRATSAGFGGLAPRGVARGGSIFFEVGGAPGASYAVLLGTARDPGLPSPFGFFHLGGTGVVLVPNGLVGPQGADVFGLTIPSSLVVGERFAFQAVVVQPNPLSFSFSNPEQIEIRF